MPIYSFKCAACTEKFDLMVGVTAEETAYNCPVCGSTNINKQLASFNVGKTIPKSPCASGSCPVGTDPMCSCSGGRCPAL